MINELWFTIRLFLADAPDTLAHFVARHLPRRVIYWATIHATARVSAAQPNAVVPELTAMDVVKHFYDTEVVR
jgi:hypothetical protein